MPTKHAFRRALFSVVILVATSGCVVFNGNFRTVQDQAFFRSGQLRAKALERRIEQHNIRTVVNLRTAAPEESWYQTEVEICQALGAVHHDIPWSSKRLPTPESLDRLLSIFENGERPILVHCQGGVHRSAVASAVFLLGEDAPLEVARSQLGRFFHDAPIGELLDLYEPVDRPFRDWVETIYPRLYTERIEQ